MTTALLVLFLLVVYRMSGLVREVESNVVELRRQGVRLVEAEERYRGVVEHIPAVTYIEDVSSGPEERVVRRSRAPRPRRQLPPSERARHRLLRVLPSVPGGAERHGVARLQRRRGQPRASGRLLWRVPHQRPLLRGDEQRLLLLVNPMIGNSVRRVFDLCALYEELSPSAALRLVLLWRHAGAAHSIVPVQQRTEWRDPRDATVGAPAPAPAADKKHQRAS